MRTLGCQQFFRAARDAGKPLRDAQTGQPLRTLSNESINKTLRTLAAVLDEAEDAGWVTRNVARGRRMREPLERRRSGGVLEIDEFLSLLEAASQLDGERHRPETLERAVEVRRLRDDATLEWAAVAKRMGVAPATAVYLYGCADDVAGRSCGPRRAVIATLGLAGPRVTELCQLDVQDVDLVRARLHVADSKTESGVRSIDVHPRLLEELVAYWVHRTEAPMDAPAFPTRPGNRRNKDNVRLRVITPVVRRANALRIDRGQPPIRTHVTPHTFRRTYITFVIAAGYDLPYVQAQVGHLDPSITLAVYARVMRRPDRDALRREIRQLLGTATEAATDELPARGAAPVATLTNGGLAPRQAAQTAANGRGIER